jgi:hypothetical protein
LRPQHPQGPELGDLHEEVDADRDCKSHLRRDGVDEEIALRRRFEVPDAGSEVRRRAGIVSRSIRLFGVPQNRRLIRGSCAWKQPLSHLTQIFHTEGKREGEFLHRIATGFMPGPAVDADGLTRAGA